MSDINETSWTPERKVVGAAVAAVILGLVQAFTDVDLAPGFEGAVAVLAAYFIKNA